MGARADELLGIGNAADGSVCRLKVQPALNTPFESLAHLVKLTVAASHKPEEAVRYVGPTGFASVDFWEAQLPVPCGSNASVSSQHALIVQGKLLERGWRALAEALVPARTSTNPIIHL